MTMRARAARAALPLFPALLALAGCGVGGETVVGGYQQIVIGPEGGTVAAQNVSLVIPPGAFTEDHVLSLLPQPSPLPIEPQGDGSTIQYHDNIMCIGPVGQPLLVDGHLRMSYPDGGYPPGLGEGDLVLLEWDDAAGHMRVSPTAVQDTVNDRFDDFDYDVLGHCAVGVRIPGLDPDEFDFSFFGVPEGGLTTEGIPGRIVSPSIVLADLDGVLAPATVPDSDQAGAYLGSGDGSRLLWTRYEPQEEGDSLHTVDVPSLAGRQILGVREFGPYDPLFGWIDRGDTVYFDRPLPVQTTGGFPPTSAFATIDGAGATPVDDVYPYPGDRYLEDVRISPDHAKVVLRFFESDSKTSRVVVDVIDVLGNVLVGDADTNTGFQDPTPRWMPDSSGIYFTAPDRTTVQLLALSDLSISTLYTMPAANSIFVDFVVAPPFDPAPQRCAYVRRDVGVFVTGIAPAPTGDFYETDALEGGDVSSFDFGRTFEVLEMVPLFSDGWQTPLVFLEERTLFFGDFLLDVQTEGLKGFFPETTLVMSLDPAGIWAEIPAPIPHIDLSRQAGFEGEMLVWISSVDVERFPEYPEPGIYHLDAFAGNPTLVTPAGLEAVGPPRWLQSWRHAPGFEIFAGVR